jgi:hypothetical protein
MLLAGIAAVRAVPSEQPQTKQKTKPNTTRATAQHRGRRLLAGLVSLRNDGLPSFRPNLDGSAFVPTKQGHQLSNPIRHLHGAVGLNLG